MGACTSSPSDKSPESATPSKPSLHSAATSPSPASPTTPQHANQGAANSSLVYVLEKALSRQLQQQRQAKLKQQRMVSLSQVDEADEEEEEDAMFATSSDEDESDEDYSAYFGSYLTLEPAEVDADAEDDTTALRRGSTSAFSRRTVNWHEAYEAAMGMPEDSPAQALAKYRALTRVSTDFARAATMYGETIITELCLPKEERSLATSDTGGIAGGAKYIVNGILFKLATDTQHAGTFLYGGPKPNPERANKSAGSELTGAVQFAAAQNEMEEERALDRQAERRGHHRRGSTATSSSRTIRVPLQVVVDSLGFRLLAMPLLPLTNNTIVYGSNDAGATVYARDEAFSKRMQRIARRLHLSAHIVGGVTIFTGGDVEGHLGTDGRRYLIDLARAMPPEAPWATPHLPRTRQSIFFRLLRPEFLRLLRELGMPALSADALSGWSRDDPQQREQAAHVLEATQYLIDKLVPEFASEFESWSYHAELQELEAVQLSAMLHKRGINVRHLGLVRSHVARDSPASTLLLRELVKRAAKNLLRNHLRGLVEAGASLFAVQETVVQFLNLTTGAADKSSDFWANGIASAICRRYGACSLHTSDSGGTDAPAADQLQASMTPHLFPILTYVMHAVGVEFTEMCKEDLSGRIPTGFLFSPADVRAGVVRVKYPTAINFAHAKLLSIRAEDVANGGDVQAAQRLQDVADAKFAAALLSEPSNVAARRESVLSAALIANFRDPARADEIILAALSEVLHAQGFSSGTRSTLVEPMFALLFRFWDDRRERRTGWPRREHCGGASSQRALLDANELVMRFTRASGKRKSSASPLKLRSETQRNLRLLLELHGSSERDDAPTELPHISAFRQASLGGNESDSDAEQPAMAVNNVQPIGASMDSLQLVEVESSDALSSETEVEEAAPGRQPTAELRRKHAKSRGRRRRRAFRASIADKVNRSFHQALALAWQERVRVCTRFWQLLEAESGKSSLLDGFVEQGVDNFISLDLANVMKRRLPSDNDAQSVLWAMFQHAVADADFAMLGVLDEIGFGVNSRRVHGDKHTTVLMHAASSGDLQGLGVLLQMQPDLSLVDEFRDDALLHAVRANQVACLQKLLQAGADPDVVDKDGLTPMLIAAASGHEETARVLSSAGANLEASTPDFQETPLMLAAKSRSTAIVRLLLEAGAYVEAKDKLRMTALLKAIFFGFVDTVKTILELGGHRINLEHRLDVGRTALLLACEGSHAEVVDVLLHASPTPANPMVVDNVGRSAFHYAVSVDAAEEIMRLVAEAGGDPTVMDEDGATPMHVAAKLGRLRPLRLLVEQYGLDPNGYRSSLVEPPLLLAVRGNHRECVQYLLERPAVSEGDLHAAAELAQSLGFDELARLFE